MKIPMMGIDIHLNEIAKLPRCKPFEGKIVIRIIITYLLLGLTLLAALPIFAVSRSWL
jgi:hypothetical protein